MMKSLFTSITTLFVVASSYAQLGLGIHIEKPTADFDVNYNLTLPDLNDVSNQVDYDRYVISNEEGNLRTTKQIMAPETHIVYITAGDMAFSIDTGKGHDILAGPVLDIKVPAYSTYKLNLAFNMPVLAIFKNNALGGTLGVYIAKLDPFNLDPNNNGFTKIYESGRKISFAKDYTKAGVGIPNGGFVTSNYMDVITNNTANDVVFQYTLGFVTSSSANSTRVGLYDENSNESWGIGTFVINVFKN